MKRLFFTLVANIFGVILCLIPTFALPIAAQKLSDFPWSTLIAVLVIGVVVISLCRPLLDYPIIKFGRALKRGWRYPSIILPVVACFVLGYFCILNIWEVKMTGNWGGIFRGFFSFLALLWFIALLTAFINAAKKANSRQMY